jgi:hypothetical protein
MNKKLLLIALGIPFLLNAQKVAKSNIQPAPANNLAPIVEVFTEKQLDSSSSNVLIRNQSSTKRGANTSYNFIQIGNTYYDLQTNASIGRRIMLLPNGKVSAAWTTSDNKLIGFPNRGTGYNFFDSLAWFPSPVHTARVETSRTGWPSLGMNGNSEWVMGHDATLGGFVKSQNSSIGSKSWTSTAAVLTQNKKRPIWGRVANSGNYFHCIANYSDSGATGEPRAPTINGVFAPMTYSRSTDGGATWSTQHMLLPGYDSTRYNSGGGDQYAIDVKDSIVVIVSGDMLEDVAMWKSTDNGLTFKKTIMDTFDYAPYVDTVVFVGSPFVCDGSLDVIIDKNGKAHAFWGVTNVTKRVKSKDSSFFSPAQSLLAYWSENAPKTQFIAAGSQFPIDPNPDLNVGGLSDTIYSVYPGTYAARQGNFLLKDGSQATLQGARLTNTALLRSPSAGMDNNGNIFVTFSLPVAGDVDDAFCNFRDIMMVTSNDNGLNWENPIDITKMKGSEEDFGCIAKKVDKFVHLIFQQDEATGTNLSNRAGDVSLIGDNGNYIMYAAVPVSKILDGTIGNSYTKVERLIDSKEIFVVSQNQPNPFSSNSEVLIWLENQADVTLEITNVMGQVVSTVTYSELGAGNQILKINGDNLTSGVYFYTVKTSTNSVTQKMMIEH